MASDRVKDLVGNIDEALVQNPALTDRQLEDVRMLRAKVRELCRSGRIEDAKQCQKLTLNIIREGAPVPE